MQKRKRRAETEVDRHRSPAESQAGRVSRDLGVPFVEVHETERNLEDPGCALIAIGAPIDVEGDGDRLADLARRLVAQGLEIQVDVGCDGRQGQILGRFRGERHPGIFPRPPGSHK